MELFLPLPKNKTKNIKQNIKHSSAAFFGGWLKQGRFGTKEFPIKKTKLGMFLGTPSFLPKNNLDHGAERRQSRPFASFVQAFLIVG